jgi:hypothetical protein
MIGTIRILIDVEHVRTHNECGYERVGASMAYNKESLSVRPGAGGCRRAVRGPAAVPLAAGPRAGGPARNWPARYLHG